VAGDHGDVSCHVSSHHACHHPGVVLALGTPPATEGPPVTWWAWAAVAAVVWLTLSVTIGLATAALLDRHYLNDPTD
jgi:hypothetical protein